MTQKVSALLFRRRNGLPESMTVLESRLYNSHVVLQGRCHFSDVDTQFA